jgi:phage-related minor tail protein
MSNFDSENSAGQDLDRLNARFSQTANTASVLESEVKRVQGAFSASTKGAEDFSKSMSSAFQKTLGNAVEDVALNGKTLSDALKDVGQSMARTALNSAVKPVTSHVSDMVSGGIGALFGGGAGAHAQPLSAPAVQTVSSGGASGFLSAALGGGGGGGGGFLGGLLSDILPFADGGVFSGGRVQAFANGGALASGRVQAFASGGIVSSPTTFPMRGGTGLMGEAGPEAIMPLTRGADGKLGVRSQGGGGRPTSVVMNITTPDVQGFQRSQSQIAAQMSRMMGRSQRAR